MPNVEIVDIIAEYWQWSLFAISPVLAVFTAKGIYNAVCVSRAKELRHERDVHYAEEHCQWWGAVQAHKGLRQVFCPRALAADETCYAYFHHVSVFTPEPFLPNSGMTEELPPIPREALARLESDEKDEDEKDEDEKTLFDIECGVSPGLDWSVLDWFPVLRPRGKCHLFITNTLLCLKGELLDIQIPLEDIAHVAASCASVMIGTRTTEVPLLLGAVNGPIVRDVIHLIVDAHDEMSP